MQLCKSVERKQLGNLVLQHKFLRNLFFFTTGPSRQFKINNLEVALKHVSPKKLPFPESKVGLAILALWHLSKNQVAVTTIQVIKNKLTTEEFEKFKSAKEYMPGWMADVVFQSEKENESV